MVDFLSNQQMMDLLTEKKDDCWKGQKKLLESILEKLDLLDQNKTRDKKKMYRKFLSGFVISQFKINFAEKIWCIVVF